MAIPCRSTNTARARRDYYGFELGADAKLGRRFGMDWGAELVADAVRARRSGLRPGAADPTVPRARRADRLASARSTAGSRSSASPRSIAPRRTRPTPPGYTLVNASLDWHPFAANPELTLSLQGNNLFDVVARRHSSLLKDYAPLSGRDIRLSARLNF